MKATTKIGKVALGLGIIFITACQKKPMACFEASPSTVNAGQSVNFSSSCSMDAHHYEWNFGDGATSKDANPSHSYSNPGTYTVKLMTMSKNSKKMDETSKTITVN